MGGHIQRGPSGKKGGGMEGGPEWEESPGCQGVTSLDTTSSAPGNRCDSPPCYPLPPSLSLSQLVNNTRTYTHTYKKKPTCGVAVLLSSSFITCTVVKTKSNKCTQARNKKKRENNNTFPFLMRTHIDLLMQI